MSQPPLAIPPIPRETARVARAVFGSSNFYLLLGDRLERIIQDLRLARLHPAGEPAPRHMPLLALVTYFQFLEEIGDRQATDALRSRPDWKYALHLPPGGFVLHPSGLCRFRQMLLDEPASQTEFERLLARLRPLARPCEAGAQPVAVTDLVLHLCRENRLRHLYCATQHLVEALAQTRPVWLSDVALPHWYTRYRSLSRAFESRRNALSPLTESIGADGTYLLEMLDRSGDPEPLPQAQRLRSVLSEQFRRTPEGALVLLPLCRACGSGDDVPSPQPPHGGTGARDVPPFPAGTDAAGQVARQIREEKE